ncbi:hypothetical protein Syun_000791 [Stephania yunnanensis]|uniref:Uncharacterized protein n=1 Tax=Stephania yunnanensis TaxID=152371 RepID=A0AAP0LCS0_9MAGN
MAPNGDNQKSTKPPPSPSPLRNSKFFQVWSSMRRFDQPQRYKLFVSRCVEQGGVNIGSVKEVSVKIGLPATTSTEGWSFLMRKNTFSELELLEGITG